MADYTVPNITTSLPGPEAQRLLDKDRKYISPSYARAYPLVVRRGSGMRIEDVDGNVFLDMTAGLATCTTGHCHPEVVAAIKEQAETLIHFSGSDFYYLPQIDLAEKLASVAPGDSSKKVLFCNSGAEAVESALKLARYYTGRYVMLAYTGAFHGRTYGALSLTNSKVVQRKGFGPFVPGVYHIPYPYCYRCPFDLDFEKCSLRCLNFVEEVVFKQTVSPEEVAAVIIEPVLGEGGYIVPPAEYMQALRELTEKHHILLILDEIQTGMGRTGKMFAVEHFGVVPDILCLAKGLASGLPLGAIIADAKVMTWEPGAHASTFGGNPVACAAALRTIELLESELLENAGEVGSYLYEKLKDLGRRYSIIGDVRGLGLMVGVEVIDDPLAKKKAAAKAKQIVNLCFERRLILLTCGENVIRFSPALIVGVIDIDEALEIFEESIKSLSV